MGQFSYFLSYFDGHKSYSYDTRLEVFLDFFVIIFTPNRRISVFVSVCCAAKMKSGL